MVVTKTISRQSRGNGDMINITDDVERQVLESGVNSGTVTVFVAGSTAAVSTIEYEPGLEVDFKTMWDRVVPRDIAYEHDRRWGDGNGYSHVRASLLGASLVVPFQQGKLILGTWQQIILMDFDNRPRSRQITLQIMGE